MADKRSVCSGCGWVSEWGSVVRGMRCRCGAALLVESTPLAPLVRSFTTPAAVEVAEEWKWRECEAAKALALHREYLKAPGGAGAMRCLFEALAYAAEVVEGYPYPRPAAGEEQGAWDWVHERRSSMRASIAGVLK